MAMTPKSPREPNQFAKDQSKLAASIGGLFHFGAEAERCRWPQAIEPTTGAAALVALSWWIGWGVSSDAPPTATDVTVGAATEAREAAAVTQGMTNVANDTVILMAKLIAAGDRSITEAGAFDAPTNGSMDVYADFGVITLKAGDAIAFTLSLRFQ
jgi:hypothetical protein